MRDYRADLHIHTLLSPCGDLSMSPARIIDEAARKGIEIIGITDHNTTRHGNLVKRLAAARGIFTMTGAEVTTKEEVHCLAFFENTDTLEIFQKFLDERLPDINNDPLFFGDQVEVDENEIIIYTEERLLTNAINVSLEELEDFVHRIDGIFIPAHIDRTKNSIYSQLGFLPADLKADALEISWRSSVEKFSAGHPEILPFTLIRSSDAHFPGDIGRASTLFKIEKPSFTEIRKALNGADNRTISVL